MPILLLAIGRALFLNTISITYAFVLLSIYGIIFYCIDVLMGFILFILSYAAAIGVWIRFASFIRCKSYRYYDAETPRVSIVIPARNEASNIGRILNSLLLLDYAALEIIVVDDHSRDNTFQIAKAFPVKVISATERPAHWTGKTWACHLGAQAATGEYLLFTDADTIHKADSLKRAMGFIKEFGYQLISSPPYHANQMWWEKFLGAFYCLIYSGASPTDRVSAGSPYALGQYLLIEAGFYRNMGGHASICSTVADDASLARKVMENKGRYRIYNGPPLFEVQMYRSFSTFVAGWHRIIRLGMHELNMRVMFNAFLPLLTFDISAMLSLTTVSWIPALSCLLCFALAQSRIGRFSFVGIVIFPIPVLFFVLLASHAFISQLFNMPLQWRGRKYYLKNHSGFFVGEKK